MFAAVPKPQPSKSNTKPGSLNWFHWLVVTLSLVLTFVAWQYATIQQEDGREQQFIRESNRVVNQVQERMLKYEDALWGGVAMRGADEEALTHSEWLTYASSLKIEERYPGINGLGYIAALSADEIPNYLAVQRQERPEFKIHPEHTKDLFLPIVYVEPSEPNKNAIGLDMSHEVGRYTGSIRARDTGLAQITAPIVLVQDAQRSPGFLFFAPVYKSGADLPDEGREADFEGLIYAPFVVEKLMAGTLSSANRHVGVRILDGETTLYDEHVPSYSDYDPNPQFSQSDAVSMYGRQWVFDIRSAKTFREAQDSSQPLTILICGLLIDAMLIGIFSVMARSRKEAEEYADAVTEELQIKAHALEESNAELERFAYVASHDLQEPVRMVDSFAELLGNKYKGSFDETGERWLGFMVDGAKRMKALVKGLLEFSRVGKEMGNMESLDTNSLLETILHDLSSSIEEGESTVTSDPLPDLYGYKVQITAALQNLITNALKFRQPDVPAIVHISCEESSEAMIYSVRDNGIGIEKQYADRVFIVFQRLHVDSEFEGTGIGLAITLKVAETHGGKVWFENNEEEGVTFFLKIPRLEPASLRPQSHNKWRRGSHDKQTH